MKFVFCFDTGVDDQDKRAVDATLDYARRELQDFALKTVIQFVEPSDDPAAFELVCGRSGASGIVILLDRTLSRRDMCEHAARQLKRIQLSYQRGGQYLDLQDEKEAENFGAHWAGFAYTVV